MTEEELLLRDARRRLRADRFMPRIVEEYAHSNGLLVEAVDIARHPVHEGEVMTVRLRSRATGPRTIYTVEFRRRKNGQYYFAGERERQYSFP